MWAQALEPPKEIPGPTVTTTSTATATVPGPTVTAPGRIIEREKTKETIIRETSKPQPSPSPQPTATVTCNPLPIFGDCRRGN